MMESVDAGCMRHVNKNDRCVVNKAPGRNRPRECILYWSMRAARARAALLVTDRFLFRRVLPRPRGIQKQSHTNGLQQRCPENAPRLIGSRGWHQVPSGSLNPKAYSHKVGEWPNFIRRKDCELKVRSKEGLNREAKEHFGETAAVCGNFVSTRSAVCSLPRKAGHGCVR